MHRSVPNNFIKTTVLVVMLIGAAEPLYSQRKEKLDSLFAVLNNAKQDSTRVRALNALAFEYRRNDPDTAVYFANEALTLASKANYSKGIINASITKGIAETNLGNFDDALKDITTALNTCDQSLAAGNSSDRSTILILKATALSLVGNIYDQQGNYSESLKNNFEALKIRQQV